MSCYPPLSAALIREILPVIKFEDLVTGDGGCCDLPESCAVCLFEFEGEDEIRWLKNCKHIFHRACLDRWMDHDRKTCPLCRNSFVPDEMQEEFNQRLWAANNDRGAGCKEAGGGALIFLSGDDNEIGFCARPISLSGSRLCFCASKQSLRKLKGLKSTYSVRVNIHAKAAAAGVIFAKKDVL
ncbi:hypothetical protein NC652_006735 [Populus alba x Populus x berolinensis]|nr:hypothetical protein NC652_006735 [Populus alba x Populus x berolinensis]